MTLHGDPKPNPRPDGRPRSPSWDDAGPKRTALNLSAMTCPTDGQRQLRFAGRLALTLAVGLLTAALAACGGGGSSSNSTSNPSSPNYDPATTAIHDAGLEVCGEHQQPVSLSLSSDPGLSNTRSFAVAKDCHGAKVSPNAITIFQFASRDAVDKGFKEVEAAYPKGSAVKFQALVILALGPDREANLTAVKAQLAKSA